MSKVTTPVFRTSYVTVFEPRKAPGSDKPKYSLTALFTDEPEVLGDAATLADMKALAVQVALEKFGDNDKTKAAIKSGKIKMPFLKNDEGKYPDEFTTVMRFNCDERFPPQVVDRLRGPDGKPMPITDSAEFYSGCWAIATVRAFAYDTNGNKGVSFALGNLMKILDDERLDGRSSAASDFADFAEGAGGTDAAADGDLSDML